MMFKVVSRSQFDSDLLSAIIEEERRILRNSLHSPRCITSDGNHAPLSGFL